MNYYQHHIFFCNNQRQGGGCSKSGAAKIYRYAKDKCRSAGLLGSGKIGVSESRCLGRCEFSPVLVIYPDNIWYRAPDEADIDEIIAEHLLNGKLVKRLQID